MLAHCPQLRVNRQGCTTFCCSGEDASLSPQPHLTAPPPDCTFDEELFLQALCEGDSEDDYPEPDPVLDDLYFRRVQHTLHQTSSNPSYDRFLPQYWTPEEEVRVRTIYLGSQRRPWYHAMQGLRSVDCFYAEVVKKLLKTYPKLVHVKAYATCLWILVWIWLINTGLLIQCLSRK